MVAIEVKHTPGPWKIDFVHSDDLVIVPVEGRFAVLARVATQSYRDGMDEETIANAKLMAAAPQLLESVRAMLKILADISSRVSYSNNEIGHITDAEDAVIAATPLDEKYVQSVIETAIKLGF